MIHGSLYKVQSEKCDSRSYSALSESVLCGTTRIASFWVTSLPALHRLKTFKCLSSVTLDEECLLIHY